MDYDANPNNGVVFLNGINTLNYFSGTSTLE
jgi:hypothetical protein